MFTLPYNVAYETLQKLLNHSAEVCQLTYELISGGLRILWVYV